MGVQRNMQVGREEEIKTMKQVQLAPSEVKVTEATIEGMEELFPISEASLISSLGYQAGTKLINTPYYKVFEESFIRPGRYIASRGWRYQLQRINS